VKNTITDNLTIAIDAMGGDHAPIACLDGLFASHKLYPSVKFIIFGNQDLIMPILNNHNEWQKYIDFVHTSDYIASDEQISTSLRSGKNSSMRLAIDAVKNKTAHACVSSGNTGALMAMAKIVLKTINNIDRPAIATSLPTCKGKIIMLDLGANSECNANNLLQFALMGSAFAQITCNKEDPSIGILNIGSEDIKGNDTVKMAAKLVKESTNLNFKGFIEGNDITLGTVDVVVTDGFTGNVALKTIEGTAKLCVEFMKRGFKSNIFSKLGYLLAQKSLKAAFKMTDHRYYNGAMFLGIDGIVVKSHGSSDAIGFQNAIEAAINLADNNINEQIVKNLQNIIENDI
jgi:phosphate acyltransferase